MDCLQQGEPVQTELEAVTRNKYYYTWPGGPQREKQRYYQILP